MTFSQIISKKNFFTRASSSWLESIFLLELEILLELALTDIIYFGFGFEKQNLTQKRDMIFFGSHIRCKYFFLPQLSPLKKRLETSF